MEVKNAPQMAIVYKRQKCNPTPLVHQDMTKKTALLIQGKCKIGLWFLSSVTLININVCTKSNFNPISTFQDMARISNHYEING